MDGTIEIEAVVELPSLRLESIRQSASGPFQRAHELDHPALTYVPPQYREPARACMGSPHRHRSFTSVGPAMFVPPHVPVHVHSPGFGDRSMLVLHFFNDDLNGLLRQFEQRDDAMLTRCCDIRERRVIETMDRMRHEFDTAAPGRTAILSGLGMLLVGELTRYFAQIPVDAPPRQGALADWQMHRLATRIADEACPPPDIDELAAICGLGRRHFMRAFKARTGRTAMEWVETAMFDRACQLLAGDHSIKEISALLGYAHPGSFATAFLRRFGQSPRAWRTRNVVHH